MVAVHGALLVATLVALVLALLDRPPAPIYPVSLLTLSRIAVGLIVVLLVPGVGLAQRLFRREVVADRTSDAAPFDSTWLLAAAGALAIPACLLHIALLRLLGIGVDGPVLTAVLAVEGAAFLALQLRGGRGERAELPSRAVRRGLALGLVPLAIGVAFYAGPMSLDSTLHLDFDEIDPLVESWGDAGRGDLAFERDWELGERFVPEPGPVRFDLINEGDGPRTAELLVLVHGPKGFAVDLEVSDLEPLRFTEREHNQNWANAPRGMLVVHQAVPLALGERASATLEIVVPEGAPRHVTVQDLTGLTAAEVLTFISGEGVYSGSLGGIIEQDMLARELAHPRGHPRWTVFGREFGVPPGYMHLAAAIRFVASPHTASFSAFLLLQLAAWLLLGLRAIQEEVSGLDPLLGLGLGCVVLQHLHAVYDSVEYNFADNWYTLGLLASVLALATRRPRLFATWAMVATVSRYPGVAVAGLAALALLVIDPENRRSTRMAILWLVGFTAALLGAVLVVGTLTGDIGDWIATASHEGWGEHFEQNPDVPLLDRASEFLAKWGAYGGLGLLFVLPLRGVHSRLLLATVLLYAPALMFIDHFANHYILPLMAMGGVAVAANLAQWAAPLRRRLVIVVWAAVLGVLVHPWVWWKVWETLKFHE